MADKLVVPGIGVGGMTDKYEIKILICYLLHSVKAPLSREQLSLIFQEEELVNYFSFCDALNELIESNHLAVQKEAHDEIYSLNSLGNETAERLDRNLPKSLRDNVVAAAMRLIARLKIERENEVDIQPYQNGYRVICVSHDGDFILMRLELYAPDDIQAQRIRERFLADPVSVYKNLICMLVEQEPPEE